MLTGFLKIFRNKDNSIISKCIGHGYLGLKIEKLGGNAMRSAAKF